MVSARTATGVSILRCSIVDLRLILRLISTITRDLRIARIGCLAAGVRIRARRLSILRLKDLLGRTLRVTRNSAGLIFDRAYYGINVNVDACIEISTRTGLYGLVLLLNGFISSFRFQSTLCVRTRSTLIRAGISFPVALTCANVRGLVNERAYVSNDLGFSSTRAINARADLTSSIRRFEINVYLRNVIRLRTLVLTDLYISNLRNLTRRINIMMMRQDLCLLGLVC